MTYDSTEVPRAAARHDPRVVRSSLPRLPTCLALALSLGACGAGVPGSPAPGALAGGRVPATAEPVSIGIGPRLRPGPGALPQPGLPCRPIGGARDERTREAVHLELFAQRRIVIVPAGIGIGAPRRTDGAFVRGGRCAMPLRTTEPTGVIELTPGTRATVGDLFAVWGRKLGDRQLLSFRGPVRAWVDGRRDRGPVGGIALLDGRQIVIVVGPPVPVHATYAFPPEGVSRLQP